jgi:hypothetical protein
MRCSGAVHFLMQYRDFVYTKRRAEDVTPYGYAVVPAFYETIPQFCLRQGSSLFFPVFHNFPTSLDNPCI